MSQFPGRRLNRRTFLEHALRSSAFATVVGSGALAGAADAPVPTIAVFSKVYQTLNLNFDEAAEVTAEAGLDGVDCPVRPAGEVLPERVAEDLPRYAQALKKRGRRISLLTTAITSPASPQAEKILRAAKALGIQYYRIGFVERAGASPAESQIAEMRTGLKDLAALNQQIGMTAMVQNHSPSGHSYLGGDLREQLQIVSGFDPAQIGVAFDIGHALIVHGDGWRPYFDKLKPYLKVAYVKDAKREGRWLPFGEGDVGNAGYFTLLKQMNYHAPFSMHLEYDWTDKGAAKDRAGLVKALKASSQALKAWWEKA